MTCKMLTLLTMISWKSLVQTNLLDCKSKQAGFLSDKSWQEKTVKLQDNSLPPSKCDHRILLISQRSSLIIRAARSVFLYLQEDLR